MHTTELGRQILASRERKKAESENLRKMRENEDFVRRLMKRKHSGGRWKGWKNGEAYSVESHRND